MSLYIQTTGRVYCDDLLLSGDRCEDIAPSSWCADEVKAVKSVKFTETFKRKCPKTSGSCTRGRLDVLEEATGLKAMAKLSGKAKLVPQAIA